MASTSHTLFGSCACERNQYTITVPATDVQQAQVFFDNSTATRRFQATPVSAWLRVPLSWYSSCTVAQFADESHVLIRRTFYSAPSSQVQDPARRTRRQFCGFCGTHLTKAEEAADEQPAEDESIDITLGSLEGKSLEDLEALGVLPSEDETDEDELQEQRREQIESAEDAAAGLMKQGAMINEETHIPPAEASAAGLLGTGGMINDETHIPNNENASLGVDAPSNARPTAASVTVPVKKYSPPHEIHHRGIPYFEFLVDDSRLGRLRRRTATHTYHNGRMQVQWEIIELGDEPGFASVPSDLFGGNKRVKISG